MHRFIFIFSLVIISSKCFAQITTPFVLYERNIHRRPYETGVTLDELWEIRKAERMDSYDAIKTLKNGTLVFLLDFKSKKEAYFIQSGNKKAATKLAQKQSKINKSIIRAIDSLFKFCPVVYISTDDIGNLIEKKYDSVKFYNEHLEMEKSFHLKEGAFLIGEFGHVEQDEAVFSHNDSIKKNYGGQKTSISALVIRKPNMVQLRKPFPYYQKYFPFGIVRKRYNRPTRLLNVEIQLFFNQGAPQFIRIGETQ